MEIDEMIKKQVTEIEKETQQFLEEEVDDNISDILAKQKIKERGFKTK